MDHRHAAGAPVAAAGGARAHPRAGGRQEPAAARGDGSVAGVRARGAARRGAAHSRRCGLLPGGARRARQERRRASSKTDEELDHAIRQIVSKAVVSDEVVDIFAAAGLKKPDISILSDEFLAEVRGMPQRNLAVELLQKLLKGEIRARSKRNIVQARSSPSCWSSRFATIRTARSRRRRSSRS